ncbi:PTS mannose transporter subunit IIAB [Aerococcaceae bacterium DSM 111022]|nr:PTS mannose transporter subunit IIAB [Aerococcaceae bacterium DSM 111022]MBG9989320.1 PTS mannose transporter subunit IIAB [Aerococcaceae bacterium DSM 111176]
MVNIILASHGELAAGLLQSAEMIFGEQQNIKFVTFMPSEGPDDLQANLTTAVESFGPGAEILFLVDLWGGSPFNQANIIHENNSENTAIVSGMNLPILLEALGHRMGIDNAHQLAETLMGGETGVRVKPESLEPVTEEAAAPAAPVAKGSATLEPGTVLGDGKIKYVLARVDTRLLHGQVATGWAKAVNPTRIIVVSDKVAEDDMRKTLIKQSAPTGMSANVIPLSKLAEIDNDPRFGSTRALILFETPQEALEAIKLGVDIKELNLGSMAHSTGKELLTNAISVDQEDIDTLKELRDMGVKFDIRKVPSDTPENFESLLKKSKYS